MVVINIGTTFFFFLWRCSPTRAMASSFLTRFLDHTRWRTTVGRTPLDEWSTRRRDPYLTTHNTHNRQTSMPPVGFEPTISADERSLRLRLHDHWDLWYNFIAFINLLQKNISPDKTTTSGFERHVTLHSHSHLLHYQSVAIQQQTPLPNGKSIHTTSGAHPRGGMNPDWEAKIYCFHTVHLCYIW